MQLMSSAYCTGQVCTAGKAVNLRGFEGEVRKITHVCPMLIFLLKHLFLVLLAEGKRPFQLFASYPQMKQAAIQIQLSSYGSW